MNNKKDFSIIPFGTKVEKPWGYEIILTPSDSPMTGKIAFTKAGERWSFQYHNEKTESICLIAGEAKIILENNEGEIKEINMEPFKSYLIKPGQKHRLQAKTDCLTLEASTPESKGKTVRLADDYGRGEESETERIEMRKNEKN